MFQGFSDSTVDFLWGIRFNNERVWFEAHKDEFKSVLHAPMKELMGEVYDHLCHKYPEQGFVCKLSRIYRDARRLFGRGPYKDHLWFTVFKPTEEEANVPVFWFELGPDDATWGMGCYCVRPMTMAKLRARLDADPAPMEALMRRLNSHSSLVLEGSEYKRPKSAASSPLVAPWYLKKEFSFCHTEPISSSLYSHELVERILADFDFLMPFYEYFSTLDGDPEPTS